MRGVVPLLLAAAAGCAGTPSGGRPPPVQVPVEPLPAAATHPAEPVLAATTRPALPTRETSEWEARVKTAIKTTVACDVARSVVLQITIDRAGAVVGIDDVGSPGDASPPDEPDERNQCLFDAIYAMQFAPPPAPPGRVIHSFAPGHSW